MNLIFSRTAWQQYVDWQTNDKKTLKRINLLIQDICRNGVRQGIGKPEPLKLRKAWSRRINKEHRLIYNMDQNGNLVIYSCSGHYEEPY